MAGELAQRFWPKLSASRSKSLTLLLELGVWFFFFFLFCLNIFMEYCHGFGLQGSNVGL